MHQRFPVFLVVFLISWCCIAQEKVSYNKQIEEKAKLAEKNKDIAIFDEFVKQNPATNEISEQWVNVKRAKTLMNILKEDVEGNTQNGQKALRSYIAETQKGIDSCSLCSICDKIDRFEFLDKFRLKKNKFYQTEIRELRKLGFRQDRSGVAMGIVLSQNNATWIGGEVSLLSYYSPTYIIKDPLNPKLPILQSKRTMYLFVLPFTYSLDVQNKYTEWTVALFQLNAPIMINITKFGYRNEIATWKGSAFYRPEIGVGFGKFSLNYHYTMFFNKNYKDVSTKHGITLRFASILAKKI